MKNLYIKREQCVTRCINAFKDGEEIQGRPTLQAMGMKSGEKHQLIVRFVRALAILTHQDLNYLIDQTDQRTGS